MRQLKFIMKKLIVSIPFLFLLIGCSSKKQVVYLNNNYSTSQYNIPSYTVEPLDILKIEVHSSNYEAALPYNKLGSVANKNLNVNLQTLQLDGYVVDNNYEIIFPVLGSLSLKDKTVTEIEKEIVNLLIEGGHIADPIVSVRLINSKFTVLGEVKLPGTYEFIGERLSLLQAIGYAGDLTINGDRKEIKLIREKNGVRSIKILDLTNASSLDHPNYYIYPNDVIVVNPNFSRVKSSGFIGSPSSIASIASIILSFTLLIINNP